MLSGQDRTRFARHEHSRGARMREQRAMPRSMAIT